MSLLVALTGGIGSGKTTVLNLFKEKGVPCYIADEEAKRLMQEDLDLIESIKTEFGSQAYTESNKLNRSYISKQVFQNQKSLQKLNSLVHPIVKKDFRTWLKDQDFHFVIYESALIFETNQQDYFDIIILVTAPIEERIKRVQIRSGLSRIDILNRINAQISDKYKIEHVNFIIENIKKEELIEKVGNIYTKINEYNYK